MLAVIGILYEEVEPVRSGYQFVLETGEIAKRRFFRGVINGNEIVLTYGCVGKVETALVTQALIDRFDVDGVILVGAAGSVSPQVGIGTIVCGTGYVEYDFVPRVHTNSVMEPRRECFDKLMENLDCTYGIIASGDRFISSDLEAKQIREATSAICIDMDSAAAAKVCLENDREFLSVKIVVDFASSRAVEQYVENYRKLCVKPAMELVKFLSENLLICR